MSEVHLSSSLPSTAAGASMVDTAPSPPAAGSRTMHRWIRQLHLWIGAWGALAAVLYGSTGLIMNHRFDQLPWPQGESADLRKQTLDVPASAQLSAEALSLWLLERHGLDAQIIRKPKPASGDRGGAGKPPRWSLTGGTASEGWSLEYTSGEATAELKHSRHSTLAALLRMHKAYAGGLGWRVLSDSFAIGLILLGLSGLWMWMRGRSAKQMAFSVFAASCAASAMVLIPNLF